VLTSAARSEAVAWAPFSAGAQLVGIDDTSHLWTIASPSSATDKGAAAIPVQRPIFFDNRLIIPGATPKKYDGTAAPADLGGTPPGGLYADAYKSYFLLAGSAALPNNIWFSDVLDPEIWDTANSYIPATFPVKGIASLANVILVFSDGMTERIRGFTPPPGGDMQLEPIFQEGCIDARSIVTLGNKAIWANANGVWISDGAALENLIELGGLLQYWVAMLSSYTSSTWKLAGGIDRGNYIISITNGDTFIDALMCNIATKTWSFVSNLRATMFAESYSAKPELYFAQRTRARVGALDQIFTPSSANTTDADTTAVQPVLETVYFRGAPGSRRFRNFYIGNDIQAAGTPYLKVEYINSPEDTTYVPFYEDDGTTPRQIVASNGFQRSKLVAGIASDGIGLRITQVGASYDTMLFDIETDQHEREGNR